MTTYKGNAGNLMQHWTLCELLDIADEYVPGLNFIDAHTMAPYAHTRTEERPEGRHEFDSVLGGLPGAQSIYERAWYQLARGVGYPSSAAFVNQVWTRDFSMLLCEKDPATVSEIDAWLTTVQSQPRCKRAKVFFGDWRDKFREGLPRPWQVGLPDGSLTLVSFDPYMYNRTRQFDDPVHRREGNLYPDDVRRALSAMYSLTGGVLIQLSTYGTNDDNGPDDVIASLRCILQQENFIESAVVRVPARVGAHQAMMSLVYTRNVPWAEELANLHERFEGWRP